MSSGGCTRRLALPRAVPGLNGSPSPSLFVTTTSRRMTSTLTCFLAAAFCTYDSSASSASVRVCLCVPRGLGASPVKSVTVSSDPNRLSSKMRLDTPGNRREDSTSRIHRGPTCPSSNWLSTSKQSRTAARTPSPANTAGDDANAGTVSASLTGHMSPPKSPYALASYPNRRLNRTRAAGFDASRAAISKIGSITSPTVPSTKMSLVTPSMTWKPVSTSNAGSAMRAPSNLACASSKRTCAGVPSIESVFAFRVRTAFKISRKSDTLE
mmetsp:Transcript_10906/g.50390  ORF Transcript_10906/g.50390 Transcript_10906/m.50390 type:complete len:268 (-) Transcript_10906:84-887(-)